MSDTPRSDSQQPAAPAQEGAFAPHQLLNYVHDAVISTDLAFHITSWNPAAEALYGWPAAEAIGQRVPELLRTEYLGSELTQVLDQLREQGAWRGEVLHHHRDGHPIAIMAAVTLMRDPMGEPAGLVTVNRDISALKAAEAELRAYAARLEVITEASRAFAETSMGYEALLSIVVRHVAETMGGACLVLLLSDDARSLQLVAEHDINPEALAFMRVLLAARPIPADSQHPVAKVFRSGGPLLIPSIDPEHLRASLQPEYWPAIDRFRVSSTVVVPLDVQGQRIGALGLVRRQSERPGFTEHDVQLAQNLADRAATAIANARLYQQLQHELAERKRAEAALAAERAVLARRVEERTADLSLANAELARAARLKDEFLANMSHELRTPLNAILGRAEALKEAIYGPVTPEQIAALQGIDESGRHLLALINDILDLSKIEAGRLELEPKTLEVDLLCTLSLRMVTQAAHVKRITLTSAYDGQVQTLYADERRLKQILVNLLSNAVKFTPEGGTVGLAVRGDLEQQSVTFTVWDTGIGIAAEDMPKLFQPFVQIDSSLSRQYFGSGLGLALVAKLVQAHSGSVAVESTPSQGSRFSVTLPWSPAGKPSEPSPESAAIDITRPPIHQALVIEDSPAAAEQITRYLQALGARVEILPYGTRTVERAIALQPDLIVLDILLPDDDGWEVLRRLKAEPQTRAIPVVIVSVVDDPERARALGAGALLVKPIDRATLERTLHLVLARQESPLLQTAIVVAPRVTRPRILVAEDNEANIVTVSDYLLAKGYVPLIARDGSEAIVRAREERPDAILMDIQMPKVDGLEAIQRIRADPELARIPIIAMTALAMPGDRERCIAAGASEYLAKPVNLRALVAMIEAQLQPRRHEA